METGISFIDMNPLPCKIAFNNMSVSPLIRSVADLLRGDCRQSESDKLALTFTILRPMDSLHD